MGFAANFITVATKTIRRTVLIMSRRNGINKNPFCSLRTLVFIGIFPSLYRANDSGRGKVMRGKNPLH